MGVWVFFVFLWRLLLFLFFLLFYVYVCVILLLLVGYLFYLIYYIFILGGGGICKIRTVLIKWLLWPIHITPRLKTEIHLSIPLLCTESGNLTPPLKTSLTLTQSLTLTLTPNLNLILNLPLILNNKVQGQRDQGGYFTTNIKWR